VLVVALVSAKSAAASSCGWIRPPTPAEAFASAHSVFAARVLSLRMAAVPEDNRKEASLRLAVERVWKGDTSSIKTAFSDPMYNESIVGLTLLVYTWHDSSRGHTYVDWCNRSTLLSAAGADLASLGPGIAVWTPEPSSDSRWPAIVVAPAILLLAVLFWLRRRQRSRTERSRTSVTH